MKEFEWLDLSRKIFPGMPVYPGDPEVKKETVFSIQKDGFNLASWTLPMHAGTHMDAPCHFLENGEDVSTIGLDKCVGKANKISVTSEDGLLKTEMIETAFARLSEKTTRLLIDCQWEKTDQSPTFFSEFPGFEPSLIGFLEKNHIVLFGSDLPSIKYYPENQSQAHIDFLSKELVIVESLINLSKLPDTFHLICLPLRLSKGDGSMIRAVAHWTKGVKKN
jgi:kynurenine formamidase